MVKVGQEGLFTIRTVTKEKVKGVAVWLVMQMSSSKSADRSSVTFDPGNELCLFHHHGFIWVKMTDGENVYCVTVSGA